MTTEFRNPTQNINNKKLFWLYVKHVCLSIITLSWYRFFTKTEIRKYLWQNVELDGEPFEYTGTGIELLLGYLKAIGFVIVAYAGFIGTMMFAEDAVFGLLALIGIVAFVYFSSVAYYGALRYRLTRTLYRGIHFGLRGSAWRFGLLTLKHVGLEIVTIGFYSPYATNQNWAYIAGNMHYGDQNFSYDAKKMVPFESYAIAFLLTIFTFGASWFWYHAAITRHCLSCASLNNVRFQSTLTGGRLLGFSLKNLLLLIISFGFLMPYILKRTIKLYCDTTSLSGEIDYSAVRQDEVQLGAVSEGFVEVLGIE